MHGAVEPLAAAIG